MPSDEQAHKQGEKVPPVNHRGAEGAPTLPRTAPAGEAGAQALTKAVAAPEPQSTTKPTRVSAHRPAPADLGDEMTAAYGLAIAAIHGHVAYERAAAIEWVHAQVARIADATPDQTIDRLSAQALVLEALFLKNTRKAAAATRPEHAAAFTKLALKAQEQYLKLLGVIDALKARQKLPVVEPDE